MSLDLSDLDNYEKESSVGLPIEDLNSYLEEKDRPVAASLAGAARGLSFGLSDLALTKSGLVEPETLSDLQTYNPGASLTSELGAAIIPTLLSGGTTAPASAAGRAIQGTARVLSAPVRAVSAVGGAVTRGVAGALGVKPLVTAMGPTLDAALAKKFVDEAARTTAKNFIPTLAAKGIGSAVEGSFYGAGQVAHELALGNPDVTAENTLTTIGLSGLLSGSFPIVGGLGAKAIGASVKGMKPVVAKFRESMTGVSKDVEKTVLAHPEKISALNDFGDGPDEVISNFFSQKAAETQTAKDQLIESTTSNIQKIIQEQKLTGKSVEIAPLLDELEKLERPGAQSTSELEALQAKVRDVKDRLISLGRRASGVADDVQIDPRSLRLGIEDLNQLKKDYFKSAKWGQANPPPISKLYQDLGKTANRQIDEFSPLIREENKKISRTITAQENLNKFGLSPFEEINVEKLKKLASTNHPAYLEAKKDLAVIDEVFGTDLVLSADISRAYKALNPKDATSKFATGRALFAPAIGGALGSFGGPISAGAGFLAGAAISSPAFVAKRIAAVNSAENLMGKALKGAGSLSPNTARFIPPNLVPFVSAKIAGLSQIERWNNSADNQITKLSNHFLNDGKEPVEREGYDSLDNLRDNSFVKPYGGKEEDRVKAFQKRVDELAAYVSDPEKLSSVIAQNTHYLSLIAPKVADAMATKAALAAQYLYAQAPKNLNYQMIGKQEDYIPSDAELARFERVSAAIENPLSVLRSLGRGSVTKEEVKAVKAIYPETINLILKKIQELSDKKQLSYSQKVRLSTMFEIPLTSIGQSNGLESVQSSFVKTEEPKQFVSSNKSFPRNNRETDAQRLERGLE